LPKKDFIKIGIFIVLFGIFIAVISALMSHYFSSTSATLRYDFRVHQTVSLWLYFIYIIIACVIIPIPTLPADVVFLKLGNPFLVIGVRLLADIIGSSIDFFLARKYGRPVLKRWFSTKNYEFIERTAENITWKQFFIVAMIPIINTELMANAGGISKLKFRQIIWGLVLAILYRLLFVYFVLKF
jgi:uncharacterized membrane protein YdjX (TVP38/TMEM64 family)